MKIIKKLLMTPISIVSVSVLHGEIDEHHIPQYSGPITPNSPLTKILFKKTKNPFIFQTILDGSNKYKTYRIILKDNWKSFSVDLNTTTPQTKIKNPYLVFILVDSQINLKQHVYFRNDKKNAQTVLKTSDPDIPRDRKLRLLTHENKTISGKQSIQFQQTDKSITVLINGDKLFTYEKIAPFDYLQFGANGYITEISNLKINGYSY